MNLFKESVKTAQSLAKEKDTLVTLGIRPTFAATGYGYIQTDRSIHGTGNSFKVKRFTEKPSRSLAVSYIKRKDYLWNGGIFTWKAGVFLETMNRVGDVRYRGFSLKNLEASYTKLPKLSIDYALLEKADNLSVVRSSMDWCDMGSWDMFYEKGQKDKERNVIIGSVRHKSCRNCLLFNDSPEPLAVFDRQNEIVVKTPQGVFVTRLGVAEEAARFASL